MRLSTFLNQWISPSRDSCVAGTLAVVVFVMLLHALSALAALPTPTTCKVDGGGANDIAGQSDLTEYCFDTGDGLPHELSSVVSVDVATSTAASATDVCALYDVDGDVFANLAVCTTVAGSGVSNGNLVTLQDVRLYVCADTSADRCDGSSVIPGPYGTQCEAVQRNTDPFAGPAPGPGADYPADTSIVCAIDLADFGPAGSGAAPLDACSYGPAGPSLAPTDCLIFRTCTADAECDDHSPCTEDACDESGVCEHSPVADAPCTDGLFCNGDELCTQLGFCGSAAESRDCDDGVPCTLDSCDEITAACASDPRNSLCSDDLFCTGVEICDPSEGCRPGMPPSCNDDVRCTFDLCNDTTATCDHFATDTDCDDGRFCNGTETCSVTLGCQQGTPPNCTDDIDCTTDSCNESSDVCVHAPNSAVCSDGLFCNGAETCDAELGCQSGAAPECVDDVRCTTDACDETIDACVHSPDNAACSDGVFCTGVEICSPLDGCQPGSSPCPTITCEEASDICTGCVTDADCNNAVFCDGAEVCETGTGICRPGVPPACADPVACTTDRCDELANACVNTPRDGACDNGLYCDGAETCDGLAGCESSPAPTCDDGISCTTGRCDETTDLCDHETDDTLCDDGRFCNGAEWCNPFSGCAAGERVPCSDALVCSTSACAEHVPGYCTQDFSTCECGDEEITDDEQCDPPAPAGTFEDCNNLVDDDGDGDIDCKDRDCERNARPTICDESCTLDFVCNDVKGDPATIAYSRSGGFDELFIHGRIEMTGNDLAGAVLRGLAFQLSNPFRAVYRASLGEDMIAGRGRSRRFQYKDDEARLYGEASASGGLYRVRLRTRNFDGVPYLMFSIRAYGDFSGATHSLMTTQLSVGAEVGFLTAEWTATRSGWILRQGDF